jgi:hypothetical protein
MGPEQTESIGRNRILRRRQLSRIGAVSPPPPGRELLIYRAIKAPPDSHVTAETFHGDAGAGGQFAPSRPAIDSGDT